MVRDRIFVCGIQSKDIRERLLTEGDALTLEKAIAIAQTYEQTKQHMRSMDGAATDISMIKRGPRERRPPQKAPRDVKCGNCGYNHPRDRDKCPAKGQKCGKCHKLNHFAGVCRSSKKKIHTVEEDPDESESFYIDTIDSQGIPDQVFAELTLQGTTSASFKLDTGAQVHVLPERLASKIPQL